jgi:cytochrome bd-type quinol oxidase subunit 2
MKQKFDMRTLAGMLGATLLGAAWAYYNYHSTGGQRGEDQLRPLVWTIFATPFVLFIGWVIVRRFELWKAAFACFSLYFFTPFVAARIESLLMSEQQARLSNHHTYFMLVMALHVVGGLALSVWRARDTTGPPREEEHPREGYALSE